VILYADQITGSMERADRRDRTAAARSSVAYNERARHHAGIDQARHSTTFIDSVHARDGVLVEVETDGGADKLRSARTQSRSLTLAELEKKMPRGGSGSGIRTGGAPARRNPTRWKQPNSACRKVSAKRPSWGGATRASRGRGRRGSGRARRSGGSDGLLSALRAQLTATPSI
jgi:hypothetical protein